MIAEATSIQRSGVMASFRSRLKHLMLQKSMELGSPISQTKVAKDTGVSLATIQRWYDGTFNRIDADTLYNLLDYFGCKFEDLIQRVNEE